MHVCPATRKSITFATILQNVRSEECLCVRCAGCFTVVPFHHQFHYNVNQNSVPIFFLLFLMHQPATLLKTIISVTGSSFSTYHRSLSCARVSHELNTQISQTVNLRDLHLHSLIPVWNLMLTGCYKAELWTKYAVRCDFAWHLTLYSTWKWCTLVVFIYVWHMRKRLATNSFI